VVNKVFFACVTIVQAAREGLHSLCSKRFRETGCYEQQSYYMQRPKILEKYTTQARVATGAKSDKSACRHKTCTISPNEHNHEHSEIFHMFFNFFMILTNCVKCTFLRNRVTIDVNYSRNRL